MTCLYVRLLARVDEHSLLAETYCIRQRSSSTTSGQAMKTACLAWRGWTDCGWLLRLSARLPLASQHGDLCCSGYAWAVIIVVVVVCWLPIAHRCS